MIDENPIVEGVHRIGEQMLAEHGSDLGAMIRDIRGTPLELFEVSRSKLPRRQ